MSRKACKACGVDKDLTGFHRLTRSPDGHRSYCKACVKQMQAARKSQLSKRTDLDLHDEILQCSDCKVMKFVSEFNRDKTTRSGYSQVCRYCRSVRWKDYYEKKQKTT